VVAGSDGDARVDAGQLPGAADGALPFVSVVLPVYNEERHIEACLASVLGQDYPADRYEVLVADGGSSDHTRDIVERVGAGRDVRIIDNPGRLQAAGLNLAIRASRGSVIARQDGHAEWQPSHLRAAVELIRSSGADNVGGLQDAHGESPMGRAIACAMHSPFGVGGARFRYSSRPESARTAFLGVFRRAAFERVGLFNEAFPPHEDYELNQRIRDSGGVILFSPDIRTRYHARESLRALARQYFLYGRAKVRVARTNHRVLRPYHLVAPLALVALPTLAFTARHGRPRIVALALALYASASLEQTLRCGSGEPAAVLVRIPVVFATLQVAWGSGFWAGAGEVVRGTPVGDCRKPPRL
jgi:succinoglycan biosynthesis protein ExoA